MPTAILGIGPDAPTFVTPTGGKQSKLDYRFDLLPPLALFAIAEIVAQGAIKYGDWNWTAISVEDHINHALVHAFAYLGGDTSDDHLGHAACRLLFALELQRRRNETSGI